MRRRVRVTAEDCHIERERRGCRVSGGYPVQQREFSMRPMEVDNDGAGNKMTLATSATGSPLDASRVLEREA